MRNDSVRKQDEFLPLEEITCKVDKQPVVVKCWTLDSVFIEARMLKGIKINNVVDLIIKEEGRRDLVKVKATIKRGGPNVRKVAIDMTKNNWALTRIQEMQRRMREHAGRRA